MISLFIYVKYRPLQAFEDINRNLKPFIKAIKTPVPMSTDNAHQHSFQALACLLLFCAPWAVGESAESGPFRPTALILKY